MDPTINDQNLSMNMIKMPETKSTTTLEDINIIIDEKHRSDDRLSNSKHHTDDILRTTNQKQKSLISVYDNNPQQISPNSHSLIGILGRNKRSEAFTKRLLQSGFPKPILCDMNSVDIDSNNNSNYVSYETFYEVSPPIILITDDLSRNFEDFFPQSKQQLTIDAREKKSSLLLTSIPGSYRAFGNLSDWEIENGTQRIAVEVEQTSPLNLIKFIHDFHCFPRGIRFLDQYSYNNEQTKAFANCFFPLISTIIIFILSLLVSMIEHSQTIPNAELIYRQASSITASTSITLLAFLLFIRPVLELIELVLSKKQNKNKAFIPKWIFIQRWLQSRRYLAWYALAFALLHILLIIFSKIDFNSKFLIYGFFFGLFTLILLCILSYAYFPWISERLLWKEYRFLTSHLGPVCLLMAFIHVVLSWKPNSSLFTLKFLSIILPITVLLLRLIIYGIIYPSLKLIQRIDSRQLRKKTPTKDGLLLI